MPFELKQTSHAQSNFQESEKRLRSTQFSESHMAWHTFYGKT